MTVKEQKERLISQLELISETPVTEATEILISALNISRGNLLFEQNKKITFYQKQKINRFLLKRKRNIPLQYILGEWEFYSLPFKVGKGVLIPRPESELLVDTVLDEMGVFTECEIFDLCSGSGAIGISIAKRCPEAAVTMVEKSRKAFKYLKENMALNNVSAKAVRADIAKFSPSEKADIIVSNPPYISFDEMKDLQKEVKREPTMALYGGKDGLDFYRLICGRCNELLNSDGVLIFEIGYSQAEDVKKIMEKHNFTLLDVVKDLSGNDRLVMGRMAK